MKFSQKLDPESVSSPSNFDLKTWSIRRTGGYGARHYNEKKLKVEKAKLLADGLTVELTVPDIQPTWCMEVRYKLETSDGDPVSSRIHNTIHNLSDK